MHLPQTFSERFDELANDLIGAAESCFAAERTIAMVILVYASIDIMAWLDLPSGQLETRDTDFISWAERYVLPDSKLECSAIDLYAARCGILHTMSPESRKSRQQKAAQLLYAHGSASPFQVKLGIARAGMRAHAVRLEHLLDAVRAGVASFKSDVLGNPSKKQIVRKRLQQQLSSALKTDSSGAILPCSKDATMNPTVFLPTKSYPIPRGAERLTIIRDAIEAAL